MRISICVNHSFPSVGGCETVVKEISEFLAKKTDIHVSVHSFTVKKHFKKNNVYYYNCNYFNDFINFLKKQDVIIIYSDLFRHLPAMISFFDKLKAKKIICPVDANLLSIKKILLKEIIEKKDIKFVVHSNLSEDYNLLNKYNVSFSIIPNGVNINEFDNCQVNFRNKYNIQEKNILLNVSNFFPGKGHESLPLILSNIKSKLDDYILIFIASENKYPFFYNIKNKIHTLCRRAKINYNILLDIPREYVVSAFKESYISIFTSQKEAFGIVPVESQAAKTPWISMPVGHVPNLKGGLLIENAKKNKNNMYNYDNNVFNSYRKNILKLFENKDLYENKLYLGYNQVKSELNWEYILPKYLELIYE